METSPRRVLLPSLTVGSAVAYGHGTCREGILPSGLRKDPRQPVVVVPRTVGIDYDKLMQLCLEADNDAATRTTMSREECHQRFMASYHQLLQKEPSTTASNSVPAKRQIHSCNSSLEERHDVACHTAAIHRRKPTTQAATADTRLSAMLAILRKVPLHRDAHEVTELAHHLSHFPSLLSEKTTPTILEGVATRCLLEAIPKEGSSLPDRGGVYLILQGCVEKKAKDESTQGIVSTTLCKGDHFGIMEENFITKPSYPMYVTSSACALMRITAFDYHRVLQHCQAADKSKRLALIKSCSVLHDVSPAIIAALANDIHWDTVPTNHVLIREGETIERVGFIHSGRCKASMEVPQTRNMAQLVIGELGRGSCVGEGLLKGTEKQPYRVTTTTRVKIGWVSSTSIRMNEVKKLIPAERKLSIPVPSKGVLRQKHAKELMGSHWTKIKKDILSEVRGNQRTLGHSISGKFD